MIFVLFVGPILGMCFLNGSKFWRNTQNGSSLMEENQILIIDDRFTFVDTGHVNIRLTNMFLRVSSYSCCRDNCSKILRPFTYILEAYFPESCLYLLYPVVAPFALYLCLFAFQALFVECFARKNKGQHRKNIGTRRREKKTSIENKLEANITGFWRTFFCFFFEVNPMFLFLLFFIL